MLYFVKYIYCVPCLEIDHNKIINYFGYSPGKFGLLMYCTVVDAVKVIIDEHDVPAEIKQNQLIILLRQAYVISTDFRLSCVGP